MRPAVYSRTHCCSAKDSRRPVDGLALLLHLLNQSLQMLFLFVCKIIHDKKIVGSWLDCPLPCTQNSPQSAEVSSISHCSSYNSCSVRCGGRHSSFVFFSIILVLEILAHILLELLVIELEELFRVFHGFVKLWAVGWTARYLFIQSESILCSFFATGG